MTHTSGTNARRSGSDKFIKQFLRLMGEAELKGPGQYSRFPGVYPRHNHTSSHVTDSTSLPSQLSEAGDSGDPYRSTLQLCSLCSSCYSCVNWDEASKPRRVGTIMGDAHPRPCCSHTTAYCPLLLGMWRCHRHSRVRQKTPRATSELIRTAGPCQENS